MQAYRRFSTLCQLTAGLGVFAALALLLDSGGLYNWAQGLELGPERNIALPAATALHAALTRLGIEKGRQQALDELARIGWSDGPAEPATGTAPQPSSGAGIA